LIAHSLLLQLYHKYKSMAINFLYFEMQIQLYQNRTHAVSVTTNFVDLIIVTY
jgi:hypothetical protein